jgi:hypothetical protein
MGEKKGGSNLHLLGAPIAGSGGRSLASSHCGKSRDRYYQALELQVYLRNLILIIF